MGPQGSPDLLDREHRHAHVYENLRATPMSDLERAEYPVFREYHMPSTDLRRRMGGAAHRILDQLGSAAIALAGADRRLLPVT